MDQETVTLKIPGLTRTYTFFHTSDAHVEIALETDAEGGKQRAEYAAEKYTNEGSNIPASTLLNAIRTADEAKADGLFLCGDIGDHYTEGTIQFIRAALKEAKTEVFYVMGNHECAGAEDKGSARQTFAEMMFGCPDFWARDLGEILIVGLDNSDKYYTEEQFAFLNEQIAKNKPILLLMHAPLMTDAIIDPVKEKWSEEMGAGACDYFLIDRPEDTSHPYRRFWDLVQNPENHIMAIFAGHVHLSNDGEFAPGKRQYTMVPTYMGEIRKVIVTGE
ncbi:MAG: metallophosphoesterase [Clostridia bacterium]|nr:metallophosphoesterase [Clostridia bacterium]